jgi:BirA family biotin operon repressor/biotin-[acetyl-CoA-carboxylase] ligase
VDVVAETASTNSDLLGDDTAPDRSVLVAEYQSAGRGRLDRAWTSPVGAGLTFSVLVRPAVPVSTWGWLPLLTGVALHDALDGTALKWPNDVLCAADERKLAGLLAQTSGQAVVLGIGLNVSLAEDELPVPTATSLQLCSGSAPDRVDVLVAVLHALDRRLAQWSDVGGDAEACGLAAAYRSACATLGREVAVTTTGGERLAGTAVEVESDGRLRLSGDRIVGAGDVEHLRPAR